MTETNGGQLVPVLNDGLAIERVDEYFSAIQSSDRAVLERADGMLDEVFYRPGGHEIHTWHVIRQLDIYEGRDIYAGVNESLRAVATALEVDTPPAGSPQARELLRNWRIFAVAHVLRSMVLSEKVSTDIFPQVIRGAIQTAADIETGEGQTGTWLSKKARKSLRYDLQDAGRGLDDPRRELRSRFGVAIFDRSHRFGHVVLDTYEEA